MKTLNNRHSLALSVFRFRQCCQTSFLSLAVALISAMLLSGCAGIPGMAGLPGAEPTYTQDQEVTLVEPFKVRIDKTYWNGESLVVELTISNHGREPHSLSYRSTPMFRLVNAEGLKYDATAQDNSSLTALVLSSAFSLNPGMSLKWREIFNVPKGEYFMQASFGRYAGGGGFAVGSPLFKWTLNPSGK